MYTCLRLRHFNGGDFVDELLPCIHCSQNISIRMCRKLYAVNSVVASASVDEGGSNYVDRSMVLLAVGRS